MGSATKKQEEVSAIGYTEASWNGEEGSANHGGAGAGLKYDNLSRSAVGPCPSTCPRARLDITLANVRRWVGPFSSYLLMILLYLLLLFVYLLLLLLILMLLLTLNV